MVATDTTPEAHTHQIEMLRRLGGADRLSLTLQMSDDARSVALAGIAARRPDLDQAGRRLELIRLMYGVDLEHSFTS